MPMDNILQVNERLRGLIWGAPMLILSMLVGILVAIFQAVTQIHEQSLSFILKLLVVILILLVGGGWMLETLQDFTRYLFTLM